MHTRFGGLILALSLIQVAVRLAAQEGSVAAARAHAHRRQAGQHHL